MANIPGKVRLGMVAGGADDREPVVQAALDDGPRQRQHAPGRHPGGERRVLKSGRGGATLHHQP
jgi:hypothetical protein